MTTNRRRRCKGAARHWFAYYGWVGSSAPTCQHWPCDAPNPNYDPVRDPRLGEANKGEGRPT